MLLSRVAERLYWLARYLERAEDTARLIEALTLVRALMVDRTQPSSIPFAIRAARENARTLREVLPREAWEDINEMHLYARSALTPDLPPRQRLQVLRNVVRHRHAIVGQLLGAMTQDAAYLMIRIGRHLERADMTSRILDVASAVLFRGGPVPEDPTARESAWFAVLRGLSADQMYRRAYGTAIRPAAVLRFILLDAEFPRSIAHALDTVDECLAPLPGNQPVLATLRRGRRRLALASPETLLNSRSALHDFLDELQQDIAEIHQALSARYFQSTPIDPSP